MTQCHSEWVFNVSSYVIVFRDVRLRWWVLWMDQSAPWWWIRLDFKQWSYRNSRHWSRERSHRIRWWIGFIFYRIIKNSTKTLACLVWPHDRWIAYLIQTYNLFAIRRIYIYWGVCTPEIWRQGAADGPTDLRKNVPSVLLQHVWGSHGQAECLQERRCA